MVSEVGRQPWIVYNLMKVEDAATANTGVWITFVLVVLLYAALGVTTDLRAPRHEPALPRTPRREDVGRALRPDRRPRADA